MLYGIGVTQVAILFAAWPSGLPRLTDLDTCWLQAEEKVLLMFAMKRVGNSDTCTNHLLSPLSLMRSAALPPLPLKSARLPPLLLESSHGCSHPTELRVR